MHGPCFEREHHVAGPQGEARGAKQGAGWRILPDAASPLSGCNGDNDLRKSPACDDRVARDHGIGTVGKRLSRIDEGWRREERQRRIGRDAHKIDRRDGIAGPDCVRAARDGAAGEKRLRQDRPAGFLDGHSQRRERPARLSEGLDDLLKRRQGGGTVHGAAASVGTRRLHSQPASVV